MPLSLPRGSTALLVGLVLALPLGSAGAQQPAPAAPAATPAAAAMGALVGTVRDSTANAPLAGATVQLLDQADPQRTRSAVTGADGRYTIDSVAPGRYVVGFQHARLDLLGVQPPMRLVEVAAGAPTRADLGIAAPRTLVQSVCRTADETGLVLGRALDADTRMPLGGGTIAVIWSEYIIDALGSRSVRRQQTGATTESGNFALCGVPTDVPVILVAEHGTDASGYVEVQVPPGGVAGRELLVGRGEAAVAVQVPASESGNMPVRRGTARLAGQVRSADGAPLDRATITLFGSTARDTTGRDGRFALEALPAGTHTLEARVIGWIPQRVTVDLTSGAADTVVVTLTERVTTLAPVSIAGRSQSTGTVMQEFMRRRRQGTGRFLTADQIEKRAAFSVGDLLRAVPGVRIENNLFDQNIFVRNCTPHVFIDDTYLQNGASTLSYLVRPEEVAGIEVYSSLVSTPPQFQRMDAGAGVGGGCGSIVVWTKGRLR